MPDPVVGVGDTGVNKTEKISTLMNATFYGDVETKSKQINI